MNNQTENSFETYLSNTIKDSASSIENFDWQWCQAVWATAATNSSNNNLSLYVHDSELIPLIAELNMNVGPQGNDLLHACCTCSFMLQEEMGSDDMGSSLVNLCRNATSRAEAFICLALSYFNSLVIVGRDSEAQAVMQKSYLTMATYYNRNGRIPAINKPPTEKQMAQFARQVVQPNLQPKTGCLIPFVALTTGIGAVFTMITKLA